MKHDLREALARFVEAHKTVELELEAGARVVCGYRANDTSGQVHVGTLLATDDPRAWAGSLAFPEAEPEQAAVTRHVEECRAWGGLKVFGARPVLWDFGKVLWDTQLVPASVLDEVQS